MRVKNNRWKILDSAFISTVVTVSLIEFSQVGAGLVDGVMTSRMLGAEAMAAVGLGYPLFSIAGVVSGILALGMQSLCSKEIGRGNFRKFNEIFSATVITGFVFALLFTAALALFSAPVTSLLGAKGNSADLFEPTRQYILGLCAGAPALILGPVLAPAIQLDNGGRLVRKAALISAAADIVFNYITITAGLGLFGIGLASAISYYVNLAVLLFHFRREDRLLHICRGFNVFQMIRNILPAGSSMAVKRLANSIRPVLINNYIILLGGTAAMSALSVKNTISNFVSILSAGIIGSISLAMGIVYGEKSYEDVLHVGKLAHRVTFLGMGTLAVLSVLLASPLADCFVGRDSEIHEMVVFSVYMMAAELIPETLIGSRIAYLNIINGFKDSQYLQFCFKLLAVVPCVLIMGKLFGVFGALSGFAVAYVLLLVVIYMVSAFRNRKFKVSVRDFLRLDSSFDVSPGDVIELDIRDMNDAALVSHQVQLFCRGHGLESRTAYYSALALEESARLIFENNNYSPGLSMDIRVVVRDSTLIMRIRDNGRSSYPFGELKNDSDSDDPCANIGVKILRKTAKDIRYYHTLKINFTVITV